MDYVAQKVFVKRWWTAILKSVLAIKTIVIFGSVIIIVPLWVYMSGLDTAYTKVIDYLVTGLSGLILTFIITAVIEFRRLRELIQIENNETLYARQQKDSERDLIGRWLKTQLNINNAGVYECYLYGSITHDYESEDVDVLLLFKHMNEREYQKRQKS